MKDIVKISERFENKTTDELFKEIIEQIIYAVIGFVASRALVLGKFVPFGLSVLSAAPLTYTPAVATGVFLGYFVPVNNSSGFRYIAALFAILAIKLLLTNYKKLLNSQYFLVLIATLSSMLTAAVGLKTNDITFVEVLAEGIFCAFGTYFMAITFKAINKGSFGFSHTELTSLLITISIVLWGVIGIKFAGISLGNILSICFILAASKYGGIISGAVSGIAVAIILTFSGGNTTAAVALAFAGLMAGVFSSLGKYAQTVVVVFSGFVGSLSSGDISLVSITIVELCLGCALFLAIPKRLGTALGKVLSNCSRYSIPEGFKKSLIMRLELASSALHDVSETVEQVSNELSKINSPDFSRVIFGIEEEACKGCKLRVHCWESRRENTVNAILEMTKAIKQGETNCEAAAPDEFKGRCLKPTSVAECTYKKYSDYAARIAAENRLCDVRGVVTDQFNGISSMLYDLSLDFKNDEVFDNSAAENAVAAVKNLDIIVYEASSRIDKFGRMTIEMKIKKTPELVINKMSLMKTVSLAVERDFDVPRINEAGTEIYITLTEKADISIDIGVMQKTADGSSMCGDVYKYFYDQKGHFIMMISDGMGTGGRAAVDGAMASGLMSRLLKAGFGFDCSLKILNSSMLFKSTDESLATIDIAQIDLYTGQTELYKAGAAPSVIRRSGKTAKAESTSLPAGILREIAFDEAKVRCKVGDIVVLLSDGAAASGLDWIRAEIEAWREGSAEELAEKICEGAARRKTDSHRDDITVMAAILTKAP